MKNFSFVGELYKNDFGSMCKIIDDQNREIFVFLTNNKLKEIGQYHEITFDKVFKYDIPITS